MKKKILITVLVILALAGIVTFALLLPIEDTVTHFWFTEEVVVKGGEVENKETVMPFTVEEDDTYVIYAKWDAGKPGMITGLVVRNEAGERVFLVTGESVQSESIEMELNAGKYTAQYLFFANDEDITKFLEQENVEKFSEEYTYATNENYEIVYDFELVYADSMEYKLGFLVGLIIAMGLGGFIVIFLIKLTRKDGKIKGQYDERQLQARGDGFKYGFFTQMFYSLALATFSMAEIEIPVENDVLLMLGALLGVFVYAIYCISKEAYISLNENKKRLTILFSFIGLINLVPGIESIVHGRIIVDGIVTSAVINLVCAVEILIVTIVMNLHRSKADEEED